jgi:hypothetical protein
MSEQDSSRDREKRRGETMREDETLISTGGQDGRRSSGKRERERLLGQNKVSGEN